MGTLGFDLNIIISVCIANNYFPWYVKIKKKQIIVLNFERTFNMFNTLSFNNYKDITSLLSINTIRVFKKLIHTDITVHIDV